MSSNVRVTITRGSVELETLGRRASKVRTSGSYERTEDLAATVTALISSLEFRRRYVELRLERPHVQIRRVKGFPPVRRARLIQLVVDRANGIFRRCEDGLLVDAAWTTRHRREAVAVGASESLVSTIVSAVSEAGARVTDVLPAEFQETLLSLLPSKLRAHERRRDRRVVRRAALAAVGCWFFAGMVYVLDLFGDHRALTDELSVLEPPVAELLAARQQVNEVADVVRVVQRDLENKGWVLSMMQTVTSALPDSSFLLRLRIATDGWYDMTGLGIAPDSVGRSMIRALGRGELREVASETLGGVELLGWQGFQVHAARREDLLP